MNFLELKNVSKAFGAKKVLDELSLSVNEGECLVIFGQSGSGKTTLLRVIAGILNPDHGTVSVKGQDITAVGPESRDVAMAFQNFALYPHMSAFENIASPLRAGNCAEPEIKRRVHEVAELLRIDHVLSHTPSQLSNGQKQRTTLARSLVRRPPLLLLDDPLRNVDAKIRNEMRFELPKLLQGFGATVLYVTQDYREALALGDRIGVFMDGKFQQIDGPKAVYRQPRSTRIARLFGDPPINLFEVSPVHQGDGSMLVSIGGEAVKLPPNPLLRGGAKIVMGVRPEHVQFAFEPVEGGLPCELEAVTPFNVRTVALLRMADGTEILTSQPENDALFGARGHRKAWATMQLRDAMYFDAATGAAL